MTDKQQAKFTPGPWRYEGTAGDGMVWAGTNLVVYKFWRGIDKDVREAKTGKGARE